MKYIGNSSIIIIVKHYNVPLVRQYLSSIQWYVLEFHCSYINFQRSYSQGMIMMIIFGGLPFLLFNAVAAGSTCFVRHFSSMPIPFPPSTVHMDSEVRCALACSMNKVCDFYQFNYNDLMCSQYQAPEWPRDTVYPDVNSVLSFKGTICRWGWGRVVGGINNLLPYVVIVFILFS